MHIALPCLVINSGDTNDLIWQWIDIDVLVLSDGPATRENPVGDFKSLAF